MCRCMLRPLAGLCGGAMILTLLGLALRVGANAAATPHSTYTVSGAGDPIADGVYVATRADAKTFAATGGNAVSLNLTIFQHKGRWYIGRSGTGPLLYGGACLSAVPPLEWSASSWRGSTSPAPMPRLAASGGVDALARCHRPPPPAVCDGYTLNGAAVAVANGCYIKVAVDTFRHTTNASLELYRDGEGKWVVGFGSGVDRGKPIYISNCASSILPPACHGWQVVATGQPANQKGQSDFSFSSSTAFPLGYCPPVPPPAAKPHPRCGRRCVGPFGASTAAGPPRFSTRPRPAADAQWCRTRSWKASARRCPRLRKHACIPPTLPAIRLGSRWRSQVSNHRRVYGQRAVQQWLGRYIHGSARGL